MEWGGDGRSCQPLDIDMVIFTIGQVLGLKGVVS